MQSMTYLGSQGYRRRTEMRKWKRRTTYLLIYLRRRPAFGYDQAHMWVSHEILAVKKYILAEYRHNRNTIKSISLGNIIAQLLEQGLILEGKKITTIKETN